MTIEGPHRQFNSGGERHRIVIVSLVSNLVSLWPWRSLQQYGKVAVSPFYQ